MITPLIPIFLLIDVQTGLKLLNAGKPRQAYCACCSRKTLINTPIPNPLFARESCICNEGNPLFAKESKGNPPMRLNFQHTRLLGNLRTLANGALIGAP